MEPLQKALIALNRAEILGLLDTVIERVGVAVALQIVAERVSHQRRKFFAVSTMARRFSAFAVGGTLQPLPRMKQPSAPTLEIRRLQ